MSIVRTMVLAAGMLFMVALIIHSRPQSHHGQQKQEDPLDSQSSFHDPEITNQMVRAVPSSPLSPSPGIGPQPPTTRETHAHSSPISVPQPHRCVHDDPAFQERIRQHIGFAPQAYAPENEEVDVEEEEGEVKDGLTVAAGADSEGNRLGVEHDVVELGGAQVKEGSRRRRKMRSAAASPRRNIRITVSSLDLDNSTRYCTTPGQTVPPYDSSYSSTTCAADGSDTLTPAKKDLLLKTVLPRAIQILSAALLVNPIVGNLKVTSKCTYVTTSPADTNPGVPNSDFHLYVSAGPTNGPIAFAAACAFDAQSRPVTGHANFSPQILGWNVADPRVMRQLVYVAVHELLHALGFSDYFWRYLWPNRPATASVTRRGKTVTILTSPTVVQKARDFFGCQNLTGPELEDNSGSMSHWETRTHYHDVMAPILGDFPVLSSVTLAVLQDSGVYDIDWSRAEEPVYLAGAGCSAHDAVCTSAFCLPSSSCAPYHTGYGSCGYIPNYGDGCPAQVIDGSYRCSNPTNPFPPNNSQLALTFAADSRCFVTTANVKRIGSAASSGYSARCLLTRCTRNTTRRSAATNGTTPVTIVEFRLNATAPWVVCPAAGVVVPLEPHGYVGSVTCPEPSRICWGDILREIVIPGTTSPTTTRTITATPSHRSSATTTIAAMTMSASRSATPSTDPTPEPAPPTTPATTPAPTTTPPQTTPATTAATPTTTTAVGGGGGNAGAVGAGAASAISADGGSGFVPALALAAAAVLLASWAARVLLAALATVVPSPTPPASAGLFGLQLVALGLVAPCTGSGGVGSRWLLRVLLAPLDVGGSAGRFGRLAGSAALGGGLALAFAVIACVLRGTQRAASQGPMLPALALGLLELLLPGVLHEACLLLFGYGGDLGAGERACGALVLAAAIAIAAVVFVVLPAKAIHATSHQPFEQDHCPTSTNTSETTITNANVRAHDDASAGEEGEISAAMPPQSEGMEVSTQPSAPSQKGAPAVGGPARWTTAAEQRMAVAGLLGGGVLATAVGRIVAPRWVAAGTTTTAYQQPCNPDRIVPTEPAAVTPAAPPPEAFPACWVGAACWAHDTAVAMHRGGPWAAAALASHGVIVTSAAAVACAAAGPSGTSCDAGVAIVGVVCLLHAAVVAAVRSLRTTAADVLVPVQSGCAGLAALAQLGSRRAAPEAFAVMAIVAALMLVVCASLNSLVLVTTIRTSTSTAAAATSDPDASPIEAETCDK